MDLCLICLDSINGNYIYPSKCECRIKIHPECMELCKINGMECPICKLKVIKIPNHILERDIRLFEDNDRMLTFPFRLFTTVYSCLFLFIIVVLSLITILVVYGILNLILHYFIHIKILKPIIIISTSYISGKIILYFIN